MTNTFDAEEYMARLQNRVDRITVDATHLTIKA